MNETVVVAISAVGFLIIGIALSWLMLKSKAASAFSAGQAVAGAALATAEERVRSYERDLSEAQTQEAKLLALVDQGRQDIEQLRADKAQYQERASRVPQAEARIEELGLQIQRLQTDLQAVGEQRVALEAQAERMPALEGKLKEAEASLQVTQQQLADQREAAGRLTAKLAAEQEASQLLREQILRSEQSGAQTQQRLSGLTEELQRLNERKATLESELAHVQGMRAESQTSKALIDGLQMQLADLREAQGQLSAEKRNDQRQIADLQNRLDGELTRRESAEQELSSLRNHVTELTTTLEQERGQSLEKLELLAQAKVELSNQFKSLANDILEEKAKRFTEQNQVNIGQILDPLRVKLQEFQGKVEEVYVQEGKDRVALAEQVRQLMELNNTLSSDAKNLTRALKGSSKTQGNWGELVLERILEASGLRKGEEYEVQVSHTREDGSRAQPDVVIHLPEERNLVVDAKVSLTAYEEQQSAETDSDRQIAVKRHLDSVRGHIKGLSEKNYQQLYGIGSLDFVLMFVPIEPAFMLAITHDKELFMDAWQKNVLLVSPSTLLFVVRTVAHLWRQESQSRNAQDIAKRGAELYDKLVGFVEDLEGVGSRITQAQAEYEKAHKKLTSGKGSAIRQAEMLKQLGVKPSKKMPAVTQEKMAIEFDDLEVEPPALGSI